MNSFALRPSAACPSDANTKPFGTISENYMIAAPAARCIYPGPKGGNCEPTRSCFWPVGWRAGRKSAADVRSRGLFLHFDPSCHQGPAAIEKHREFFEFTGMDFVKYSTSGPSRVRRSSARPIGRTSACWTKPSSSRRRRSCAGWWRR